MHRSGRQRQERGSSKYKGPEAGLHWARLKNSKGVGMVWSKQEQEKEKDEVCLRGMYGILGFNSQWDGKPLKDLEQESDMI